MTAVRNKTANNVRIQTDAGVKGSPYLVNPIRSFP